MESSSSLWGHIKTRIDQTECRNTYREGLVSVIGWAPEGSASVACSCPKKLIDIKPDYSEGWRLLGLAQENLEKFDEAKSSYLKAIKLDEKNVNAIKYNKLSWIILW